MIFFDDMRDFWDKGVRNRMYLGTILHHIKFLSHVVLDFKIEIVSVCLHYQYPTFILSKIQISM